MSRIEFLSGDVWERISDLARRAKRRHVAVAYIPSGGLGMLKLAKGDILIVDLSEARVKAGGTDPAVIRQYIKRGVTVRSLPSLHAKVFVLDDTAVVGSMNVSVWSRDRLTEAGILTSEPSVVDSAREFVVELASELDPIDPRHLAKCMKLFKRCIWEPGAHIPSRESLHNWAYAVMKEVAGRVAWRPRHGHFISLSKLTDAIASAYLRLDDSDTGMGVARLSLYPADDIEQARPLYRKIDLARLHALRRRGWSVRANLHFSGPYGRGWPPREGSPPIGFRRYVEFWKDNPEKIGTRPRSELTAALRELRREGLMHDDACAEDITRLKKFRRFGVNPGINLNFKWPPFRAKVPTPATFAPQIREKLDEALNAWGDHFE